MADDTYNGWSNRETWAVALHINNDQGWQESVLETLRVERELLPNTGAYEQGEPRTVMHAWEAGEVIRENVEEILDQSWGDTSNGVLVTQAWIGVRNDIGSLWRVNWTELGAAFLRDLEEG